MHLTRKRTLPGLVALACALTAGAIPLAARANPPAPPDTAIVEIEGTSVMGSRPGTTRGGSSVVRAAIDSLPIAAAATLRDVLEQLPAVHVRTNSRGEAEISVRGSESRQVSVLYDGLPLTLSWDGRTDVSVIPIGGMQQVSFVPGLSTLLTGPNVLGGVIEFQSGTAASQPSSPGLRASAGVDDGGGFGTEASISMPRSVRGGVLTLRAGAGHHDSPGEPLASDVEQPLVGEERRINTDAVSTDGFASIRFDRTEGGWASLSSSAFRQERGIAAELGVSAPRYWRYPFITRSLSVLAVGSGSRRVPWGGAASLQASFGLDAGRTEIDAFDSIDYDTLASEEDGDQQTLSMRVAASQTLGRNADLRFGVTSSQLTYDELLTPGATSRYRHRLWNVAGESVVRHPFTAEALIDELDLGLGLSYDRSTNPLAGGKTAVGPLDELGGRAGLSAMLADRALTVHVNASRRARFPSLRELYSGALNRFTPNPDLNPEKLFAVELGATWRDRRGTLQLVGFSQRLDDAVVRIREGSRFKRVNQEGLRSNGLEAVGSRRFGGLSFGADVTLQTSEFLDPTAALEHPENLPETSGSLRAVWELPRAFTVGGAARYVGEQFALDPDSGDLVALPAGTRLDANVSHTWRIGTGGTWATTLRTVFAVDNLTDEALYDAFGLPGPGRMLRFELKLQ